MQSLQVRNVNLSFGERRILSDVSFMLNEGTISALAGANGSGKTTLLRCLSGEIEADDISIIKPKGSRIGYLPQSNIVLPDLDVYSAAEEGYNRFLPLLEEMEELGSDGTLKGAERIAEITEKLTDSGYYTRRSRIEMILHGLGFVSSDLTRKASEFSGGYQMRIALARILVENPDFLLLDEPTNYLDIETVTWLTEYLRAFHGAVMVVSHDQEFLDSLVTTVYELFNGRLKPYKGNYSTYLRLREAEIEALIKEKKRQDEEIAKQEQFIERFRSKATKAIQVQSRIKMLEKTERIEIPDHLKKLSFSFPPAPHSGNDVLAVKNLCKAYCDHVIYKDLSFLVKKGERLAITGRNGAGKSTLLRILAGKDQNFSGAIKEGAAVKLSYYAQEVENTLSDENTVLEELQSVATVSDEPRLRTLLGSFLFSDDTVFKKIRVLSGGEKSRLALLKILLQPANLLLLDEPTNHLDINSKEMLVKAIKEYTGTVIFVSHDKHFIKSLATRILYVSDEEPVFFEGDYDYFEYKLEEKEREFQVRKKEDEGKVERKEERVNSSYEESKNRRNRLKALEREGERLERLVEALEAELEGLRAESGRVEVYSDATRIKKVLSEIENKEAELERAESAWLENTEEIEKLNG